MAKLPAPVLTRARTRSTVVLIAAWSGTRIETQALAALSDRGIPAARIAKLYPDVEPAAIDEAIELEQQLTTNTRIAA